MQQDLESQAASRVGTLVVAFARLDFLLALALRNLINAPHADSLTPLIERMGFKDRTDALRDLVNELLSEESGALAEYERWYSKADRLRATRNAFVHGRWGVQTRSTVFNASTRRGETFGGGAREFSIDALDQEAAIANEVLAAFDQWHRRYVIGPMG